MEEKVKDIFVNDEWQLLIEHIKEISEKTKDLPLELNTDKDRMGDYR